MKWICIYILKDNEQIVVRTTLRHLKEEGKNSKEEKENKSNFDSLMKDKLGDIVTDEDLPEYIILTINLILMKMVKCIQPPMK